MRRILALNAGSSTLKFSAYVFDGDREVEVANGTVPATHTNDAALEHVLEPTLAACQGPLDGIGHRIVHGGSRFVAPMLVDANVRQELQLLEELAPLHLPPALALLDRARARLPRCVQVACFDTAFHQSLPEVSRRFALPDELYREGVRRYGFHGLSCEYIVSALGKPSPERLIIAHLGSGASLTAVRAGRSIDTTMGLTPAGGIPMATRSGDIDPGVLLHVMRVRNLGLSEAEHLIYHDSGFKGIGGEADMLRLLERASGGDERARAAIDCFAYGIKKQLGAYVAALGGLDCLVFTGGIGEHAALIRELSLNDLSVLGIELDPSANAQNAPTISRRSSRVAVRVIATNEDLVIARATRALADAAEA